MRASFSTMFPEPLIPPVKHSIFDRQLPDPEGLPIVPPPFRTTGMKPVELSVRKAILAEDRNAKVSESYRRIREFDLSPIRNLVVKRDEIKENVVDDIVEQYRRYMALRDIYPDLNLPISNVVDTFWHGHILSTESYRQFQNHIGRTMDHCPIMEDEDFEKLRVPYHENTMVLLRRHFGSAPAHLWPENAQICQGPYVCKCV